MKDRLHLALRPCGWLLAAALFSLVAISPARADVFGRLRLHVRNGTNGQSIKGANVTLHDTASVRADETYVSDSDGIILTSPLEIRAWQITTEEVTFKTDVRQVNVSADTTTDVDITLVKAAVNLGSSTVTIRRSTASAMRRDLNFITKFPATAGNPQSLSRVLITNPGFVQSSVNVVHPRGEHASTSIYINGLLVPGALQGRAGQIINPDIIQSADILTGGYAPEYGSETAAILNLNLRSGPIKPFQSVNFDSGSYQTSDGELTVGGQGGAALTSGDTGLAPRRFRYLLNLSDRSTDNVLEPPQPGDQSAHNHGTSATLFGNFDYIASPKDQLTFIVNSAPAHTQIANRTGLPDKYAPIGQGYGYGGARNADGTEAGVTPDPTMVGSQTIPLASQQGAGQDVYQNDDNTFSALNYRHTFSPILTGLLSLGVNHSGLDIKNNNPSIDLNSFNADGTLSQIDNSIEFNPTILRTNTQKELAGSLTLSQGPHTYKAGFIFQGQTGDELYQFVPQSQLALDALAAVQQGGPQLAPDGVYQTDSSGNPITDTLGNQVYLKTPGSTTPVLHVHRSGYYNSGYVQDTWNASRKLTLNYGLRLDGYGQKEDTGAASTNQAYLSPRFNLAYALTPQTTGRLSYDKLFTQPPLAQGAIVGTTLKPQITDAYEASIERRLSPTQTAKIAYYYKNDHNQNDTGLLIPYTQIGAYTTLQYTHASIHGVEFSYDLAPRNSIGLGAYIAYANSLAKPGGFDQTGANAPIINDHDQHTTVSTGLSYTLPSQAFAGIDVYYGSGEASSVLAPIGASNANVLGGGKRQPHSSVNLRFASPPLGGHGGLELDVDNLFDRRDVLNLNSGFSGTRFQQGRRILLRLTGSF